MSYYRSFKIDKFKKSVLPKKKQSSRITIDSKNIVGYSHGILASNYPQDKLFALRILSSEFVHISRSSTGETPLHILASKGYHQVLRNKYVDKVFNSHNQTPLYYLVHANMENRDILRMVKSYLRKHYSWYPLVKNVEINPELIEDILNCTPGEKFVFGFYG